MPIELLDKCEKKAEIAENVVEVCERLIRHLANLPHEETFLSHTLPDPPAVDKVLKSIPVEEVAKCLKLIAMPRILRSHEVMAFRTAMNLVADAFDDPLDLRIQIIKSMCNANDWERC